MTTRLERELAAAFRDATEALQPRPDLADAVRMSVRSRRQPLIVAAAAACAVILLAVGVSYAAAARHPSIASRQHHLTPAPIASARRSSAPLRLSYPVRQLAVSGSYLYVLSSATGTLSAYDRRTSTLIRQVTPPGGATAFAVGPASEVWLSFAAAPGLIGTWLLSPGLKLHSSAPGLAGETIVPVSRTAALVAAKHGLYRLIMPAPGSFGSASWRLQPGTELGQPPSTVPAGAQVVGGQVVVRTTDGNGNDGQLVIAGQPNVRYGGAPQAVVHDFAGTGGSLWVVAGTAGNATVGTLVRLDGRLRPAGPVPSASKLLSQVSAVWSAGNTVWLALGPGAWASGHSLACFAVGKQTGPVVSLPVSGQVTALAATASTVYVGAATSAGSSTTIATYPVPARCREPQPEAGGPH
ncbi:MAG TPA: hypothetical protein VGI58_13930 [Streptosporangiaceae bacterium]